MKAFTSKCNIYKNMLPGQERKVKVFKNLGDVFPCPMGSKFDISDFCENFHFLSKYVTHGNWKLGAKEVVKSRSN
jgi:hypothetical protein